MKETVEELRQLPSRKLKVSLTRLDGSEKERWLSMATAIQCIIASKGIGAYTQGKMEAYWEAILKQHAVVETSTYRYVWDFIAGSL